MLDRHGPIVVTRNGYGARCLNTPNVLFVDIDFPGLGLRFVWLFLLAPLAPVVVSPVTGSWAAAGGALVAALIVLAFVVECLATRAARRPDPFVADERTALARVAAFVADRPDWEVRAYRTPVGLRVLAVHRTFAPDDPEVGECFRALGADPLYAQMCRNQRCFRARVSPKPWRVGVTGHMRPRPGVWPVAPERLPVRSAWVATYEDAAKGFAACRYLGTFGRGGVHPDARAVVAVHDELSRATSALPLA